MSTETAIIGALIEVNGDCPPNLFRLLHNAPESFDDPRCGLTAVAIRDLRADGQAVHAKSVNDLLTFPDSLGFVLQAQQSALSTGLAELEATSAWESFQARQTAKLFSEASDAITLNPKQADDVRCRVISALHALDAAPGGNALTIRTPNELLAMEFDDGDRILGDRLLAQGQSLVIAGQGGLGKSRLLLQLLACFRAGLPFVGFETRGSDLTWLLLNAENSNRRLQADLSALRSWVGQDHWPQVSAGIFIHTLENDGDNFLSLDNEKTQSNIRAVIQRYKPTGGVAFDSLYNFGIGNLNDDQDMAATLLAIARLSRAGNPDRSIILNHHALTGRAGAAKSTGFERAGFARNSKVLHQWARGQINIAPGSPDSNDLLVISCGKCSNGKEFPPFGVRLDPATMIYAPDGSFDMNAWQSDVTGKKSSDSSMSLERVRDLCSGPMTKSQLANKIMDDCGCSRPTAFRWNERAERQGRIKWNKTNENYTPKP